MDTVTEAVADELQLLDAAEVAALLRCSVRSVYRMAGQGVLPSKRIGGLVRFRRADLQAVLS